MRYMHVDRDTPPPQVLQLRHAAHWYRLTILHGTWQESRPGGGKQHAHNIYHVVLYVDGAGKFGYRDQWVNARPGTFVACSPGESHEFGGQDGAKLSYRELTWTLEPIDENAPPLALDFHELLSLYAGVPVQPRSFPLDLTHRQVRALERLFSQILEPLTQPAPLALLWAYQGVTELLAFLLTEIYTPPPPPASTSPDGILLAKRYLEQHCCEPITLRDVAAEAKLSMEYLVRAFRRRFNITPMAYQQELRVGVAQRLLRLTNLPCQEIAQRTGFADVYCFSKAFKKQVGSAPRDYRQMPLPNISKLENRKSKIEN